MPGISCLRLQEHPEDVERAESWETTMPELYNLGGVSQHMSEAKVTGFVNVQKQ